MFQQVYEKISGNIIPISDIKVVELYLEQDKTPKGILNTPAVFIDIAPAKIRALNKYYEEVRIDFEILIFTGFLRENRKINDDTNKHFAIEQQIYDALCKFEKTGWEPMERHSSGLIRSMISYTYYYTQLTALSKNFQLNNTPVQPNIDTTLDISG